ncbi:MAG: exo-alpha-sialidase, partial [Candidatus Ratteibacteria bacterium]
SYGIGENYSYDRGRTWAKGCPSKIAGPGSRFHIRRLNSGNLLLINHYGFKDKIRSHLTAMLSEDEGKTWCYQLLLDERENVSYPDAIETEDGKIFIIYDYDRYGKKEILMAVITEQDIKSGKIVMPDSKLKVPVDR